MQTLKLKLLKAVGACLLAASSQAAIIFDNGSGPDLSYGGNNPFAYSFIAQDFVVSSASSVGSITFNALTRPSTTVPVTAVHAAIYNDNSGAVGTMLYSGVFSVASTVFTGSLYSGFYDTYDFTINVPSWLLSSGTYFLGLKVDPAQFDMHWSIPNDNLGNGPYQGGYQGDIDGTPDSYTASYFWEHMFRLETAPVPEPSTYAAGVLLLLPFGLQGIRRLRNRKQAA